MDCKNRMIRRIMKREKGKWNNYEGSLRIAVQRFCQQNRIDEETFRFLSIYQWEDVYRKVIEYFVDKSRGYQAGLHWLNTNGVFREDKEIRAVFDSRDSWDWILELPELVVEGKEKAYLLLEDGGQRPKFWIGEGTLDGIARILEEGLYNSDYYIVDKKYRWMVTCNHHGGVLFVGDGLNMDKIEDLIVSAQR